MASKYSLAFDILARDKASSAFDLVGDAADRTGGRLDGFRDGAKVVFSAVGAAGVAAAAVIGKAFFDALDLDAANDKLAAQLDLTAEQSAVAGKVAGDLYADAYGDSIEQVNDAIGAVASGFDTLDPAVLENLGAKALNLASTFDVEVTDAVSRAGVLMREGLAKDANEAFDIIVAGMQQANPELRDELGEATREYSRFFADIGISGEEMYGLLADADDQFELDKTGDAIKEFTIRATDMSELTQTAFETMGLSAGDMADRIVAGGDTARGAFEEIITALYEIEDPVTRANTAIALFGTPLEDLGVNEIPTFLTKLGEMETGLDNAKGAADRLDTTLNENTKTTFEALKRDALQGLVTFIDEEVLPEIEDLTDAWGEEGFSGALDLLVDEKLPAWLDTFDTWVEEEAFPAFGEAGKKLGGVFLKEAMEPFQALFRDSTDWIKEGRVPGTDVKPFGFLEGAIDDAFGLVPGRAIGGPVFGHRPYVVGEVGPELFVPNVSGSIVPNDVLMSGRSAQSNQFVINNPVPEPVSDTVRHLRRLAAGIS